MLTSSRTRGDVVELVARHAPGVVDADHATLAFVEGSLLRTSPAHGGAVVDDAHPLAPLETHLPRTEAARDGRLVTVANAAVYQRDHPDLLADVRHDGTASVAAVPLLDPTGATFGVLDLAWREERLFTDADEVRLTTLGALVAGTLQRVDAEQAEVRRSRAAGHLRRAALGRRHRRRGAPRRRRRRRRPARRRPRLLRPPRRERRARRRGSALTTPISRR